MTKKVLITATAIILALAGWRIFEALSKAGAQGRDGRPAVVVSLTPVQKTTLADIGYFTGSLRPRSQYVVAPKIAGRLEQVLVDIGDEVRPNQLIAVLEDDEYSLQAERARSELQVSRASLEEAKSSLDVARRELERVKSLYEKEIAAEADFDTARDRLVAQQARYEVALAKVDQDHAAAREAEVRLSYTRIRASWETNGRGSDRRVVGERFRYEGSMLTANTPIVSILDISSLLAVIHVIERDYPKVRPGMSARIATDAFPGREFTGTVARIAPLLAETSRQAATEIEIANPEGLLKPGMFVRVEITFGIHENTTVVPIEALVRRNNSQGVFMADMESMTVNFVPVRVGISDLGVTQILEPELDGRVVSLGQHLLEHGAPIRLAEGEE